MSELQYWAGDIVLKKKIHGKNTYLHNKRILFFNKWICRISCNCANKPCIHVGISKNKISAYRKALNKHKLHNNGL